MISDDRLIGSMSVSLVIAMLLLALPTFTSAQTPLVALDLSLLAASAFLTLYLIRRHDREQAYAMSIRVTASAMTSLFCCVVFLKDLAMTAMA